MLGEGAEFDVIRRVLKHARSRMAGHASDPRIRIGPGDDCAVVDGLALTLDLSIEGIHFRRDWLDDEPCGYRATAAAVSDLAAMAALPMGVLAGVAAPDGGTAEAVMRGVADACATLGAELLGGDVSRSPGPVVIDIAAVGSCDRPVARSGAHPGDELWVTGSLGGAATAVAEWLAGRVPSDAARAAYARPAPRLAEASWLAERGIPSALIDLSDGLLGDASHIAAASGLRAVIEAERVPVHEAAAGRADAVELALRGGEDYELCFAATPDTVPPHLAEFAARFGSALTRVGRLEPGEGVMLRDADGTMSQPGALGYRHFAEGGS